MKSGFDFELYDTLFKNCFIECASYRNGNLQLSLYGLDPTINQVSHFADITLDQNEEKLSENEVIVNDRFKPNLVPQLEKLGVLKEKIRMCIVNNVFYPIFAIDFSKIKENCYYLSDLVAA